MKSKPGAAASAAKRRWRPVLGIGSIGVAIFILLLYFAPDPPLEMGDENRADAGVEATAAPAATERATATGNAARAETPALPEGALPPILGEPRLDRIDYCDERNWRRVDVLVREIRGDELIVDERIWQDAGASTRAGVAGWASKCRLEGRSLIVRAEPSGRELGRYDPALGYQRFD